MLATLSTLTWDPDGYVELDVLPDSAYFERRRRVNRIATLDGGAVFNDFGATPADYTITLRWRANQRADALIATLLDLYQSLCVSVGDAVYEAAPEALTPGDEPTLRLLVSRKLSA